MSARVLFYVLFGCAIAGFCWVVFDDPIEAIIARHKAVHISAPHKNECVVRSEDPSIWDCYVEYEDR